MEGGEGGIGGAAGVGRGAESLPLCFCTTPEGQRAERGDVWVGYVEGVRFGAGDVGGAVGAGECVGDVEGGGREEGCCGCEF